MEELDDGASDLESRGDLGGTPTGVARIEVLRIAVAIVIVAIWALLYLRAAVDSKFSPPPELSAIMVMVAAWLFGSTALRGKK